MPLLDPNGAFLKFSGRGTVRANNDAVLTRPRLSKLDSLTRGCLYAHGAGGKADAWSVHGSGEQMLLNMLSKRYYVYSDDWAGGLAWGNDNAVADMNTANTLLSIGGASLLPRIVCGASMGGLQSIRYAARYPAQVAGLCLVIPALNIQELRDFVPSSRADQDTAWGIVYPTAIPTNGNPTTTMLTLASMIQCPVWVGSAPNDTLVYWASAQAFVNAVNANAYPAAVATLYDAGTAGHSDATVVACVAPAEQWLSQTFPQDVRAA